MVRPGVGQKCLHSRCNADIFAPCHGVLLMCTHHMGVRCKRAPPTLALGLALDVCAPGWGAMRTCLPHTGVQWGHFCPTLGHGVDVSIPRWGAMRTYMSHARARACCGQIFPRLGAMRTCLPHTKRQCPHFGPTLGCVVDVCAQHGGAMQTFLPHGGACRQRFCPTPRCHADVCAPHDDPSVGQTLAHCMLAPVHNTAQR